jgi:hypothetical protein
MSSQSHESPHYRLLFPASILDWRRSERKFTRQFYAMKIHIGEGVSAMTKNAIQSNDSRQVEGLRTFPGAPIAWWIYIVVILGALLTAAGAVISKADPTLLTNGSSMTDAARVYADYMFARNLSLAVMLLVLLGMRTRRMLAGLMVLVALIQVIDVLDDLARGAFVLVPGLLVFAIVFLVGAWRLFGRDVWDAEAWRGW